MQALPLHAPARGKSDQRQTHEHHGVGIGLAFDRHRQKLSANLAAANDVMRVRGRVIGRWAAPATLVSIPRVNEAKKNPAEAGRECCALKSEASATPPDDETQ